MNKYKYIEIKTRLNAIEDMQKLINALEREIEKYQQDCNHPFFLLIGSSYRIIPYYICPYCLQRYNDLDLPYKKNEKGKYERIVSFERIIELNNYPYDPNKTELENELEILELFHQTVDKQDKSSLNVKTIENKMKQKILTKTRKK